MAGLGVERIAFLFIQHGAQDVGRHIDNLSTSLFKLQRLSDQLGAENNVAGRLGQMLGAIGDAGTKLAMVATGAVLGASAISRFGIDIAKTGGHLIATKQQFESTAMTMGEMSDSLLPRLRTAMLGSVSDMDIMRLSNFALSAGLKVSATDFTRLAEASTRLAIIHGRDAPEALQRLTFGIIKQERRILDELGIVIKAKDVFGDYAKAHGKLAQDLSASERIQAFFNATLSAAETQTKSFTGVNFELAAIGDRLSATFSNFTNRLAEMFVQGGFAERLFRVINQSLDQLMTRLSQPGQMEAFFGGIVQGASAVIRLAETILELLIKIAPYAEKILAAFVGSQIGGALGDLLGGLASLIPGVGPLIGGAIKFAAPLIGAGTGFLSTPEPAAVGREIGAAVLPRLETTEKQVQEISDALRNQMLAGAPSYTPVV